MESPIELKKELSLFDSTMIVIGSMIGSGIFIVSSDIARNVGSSFYLLLIWLITGIITLAGALCYGELAAMMPRAGGQYVFLREAYNPLIAFSYGWSFFLVIQTGTIAAVAVAFAKFSIVLFPFFNQNIFSYRFYFFELTPIQVIAVSSIWVLTIINIKGLKIGKLVQDYFTSFKVISIILLIFLLLTLGSNTSIINSNFNNIFEAKKFHSSSSGIMSFQYISGFTLVLVITSSLVGSLFSSDAWNNITFAAGEVKNPARNLPLSLILGTSIVTIIYILLNFGYLFTLPLTGDPFSNDIISRGISFAPLDRIGISSAYSIFGEISFVIMAIVIMISTFGCNNGIILSGARVIYAMANDKLFLKELHILTINMSHQMP